MAITWDSTAGHHGTGSGINGANITVTVTLVVGEVAIACFCGENEGCGGVSDNSGSNVWTLVANGYGNGVFGAIYYCNVTASATTVTVTQTGGGNPSQGVAVVNQYTGVGSVNASNYNYATAALSSTFNDVVGLTISTDSWMVGFAGAFNTTTWSYSAYVGNLREQLLVSGSSQFLVACGLDNTSSSAGSLYMGATAAASGPPYLAGAVELLPPYDPSANDWQPIYPDMPVLPQQGRTGLPAYLAQPATETYVELAPVIQQAVPVTMVAGETGIAVVWIDNSNGGTGAVQSITGGGTWTLITASATVGQGRTELWATGPGQAQAATSVVVQYSGSFKFTQIEIAQYTNVGGFGGFGNASGTGQPMPFVISVVHQNSLIVTGVGSYGVAVPLTASVGNIRVGQNAASDASALLDNPGWSPPTSQAPLTIYNTVGTSPPSSGSGAHWWAVGVELILLPPVDQASWAPEFADFAHSPLANVEYPQPFYVPAISQWGLGLWWKPLIADFAPASPRPVDTGIVSYVPAIKNWGTSLEAWKPTYTDIALALPEPVRVGIIAHVNVSALTPPTPPLSWSPEFADFAHGLPRPVDTGMVAYTPAINQWGLDLWWKPLIADFAPSAPRPVDTGIVSYVPAIKNWGTSLEAWKPLYDDFARSPSRPVDTGFIAYVNENISQRQWWHPIIADFAHGLPRPVDTGIVAYTPAVKNWGLGIHWNPLYTDLPLGLPPQVPTGIVAYTPAVKNWGTSLEAWKPLYDDFARSPSRPVDTGFIAYVNENISQRQWWHPIIADFAPGLPRPVDTGIVAYTPAINQWGLDLWWKPLIADFAPSAPRPVDTGIVAYTPAVKNWGLGIHWNPLYTDLPLGLPPQVPTGIVAYTPAIRNWGTGLDAWRPVYPDRIDVLRLVQEGTFSFVNSSSLAPIVPSLSWSPTFADFARGLPSNVEYPQPFYVPAIGSWGTGLDAWHAVYGDFAFGLHQVDPGISAFVYLPPVVVSATFWHPVYDDFARAAPRPVDTGMVAYTPAIRNWGTGLDAWSPSYPDFARGFPAIVQEGCSIQVTQFADISPREHWYPIYADFAPAPRRPVDTGGVFYTPAISRWGLGLWWKPLIADFAPASPRPVDTGIVAYTPAVKNWGTGLDAWHPVHADLLPGRSLPRSVEFPQPFFINTSISQRLWWHPVYPDFVTPAKTIVDYGSSVFVYRSGISYFVGLSETDTISESLSVMAAFNPDLDETLGLSESINEGGANLFETVPWSEAIAVSLGHTVPLTDGIPASDWLDTLQAGIRRVIVLTDSEARQIDHIMHELTLGRWDYDGFAVKIGERLQVTDQILPIIDVLQIPENAEYLEPASSVTPTQASAAIKMSVLLVGSVVNALVTLPDGVTPDATKVFVARNIGGGNSAKIVPVDLEPGLTSIVLSAEFDSVTLDWEGTYWIVTSLTGSAVAS